MTQKDCWIPRYYADDRACYLSLLPRPYLALLPKQSKMVKRRHWPLSFWAIVSKIVLAMNSPIEEKMPIKDDDIDVILVVVVGVAAKVSNHANNRRNHYHCYYMHHDRHYYPWEWNWTRKSPLPMWGKTVQCCCRFVV